MSDEKYVYVLIGEDGAIWGAFFKESEAEDEKIRNRGDDEDDWFIHRYIQND